MCHLADRGLKHTTIKTYLAAVRSLHVDAGLPHSSIESPTTHRIFRGIKMVLGDKRIPKLPITLSILQQITSISGDLQNLDNANFDAACKLAWAGFLRCGEFTVPNGAKFNPLSHLSRSSVEFVPSIDNPTHIRLSLPASKTDPFRSGVTILIARAPAGSTTCPVTAMKHLFLLDPKEPTAPLFSDSLGVALSRKSFVTTLKLRLAQIGLDQSLYSGHSFRRGAATSAASVGYSDFEIQLLGRWRSDCYKLYIDTPPDRTLHLSSRLHLALAPPPVLDPLALPWAPVLA